jgi:hypothetical protein
LSVRVVSSRSTPAGSPRSPSRVCCTDGALRAPGCGRSRGRGRTGSRRTHCSPSSGSLTGLPRGGNGASEKGLERAAGAAGTEERGSCEGAPRALWRRSVSTFPSARLGRRTVRVSVDPLPLGGAGERQSPTVDRPGTPSRRLTSFSRTIVRSPSPDLVRFRRKSGERTDQVRRRARAFLRHRKLSDHRPVPGQTRLTARQCNVEGGECRVERGKGISHRARTRA